MPRTDHFSQIDQPSYEAQIALSPYYQLMSSNYFADSRLELADGFHAYHRLRDRAGNLYELHSTPIVAQKEAWARAAWKLVLRKLTEESRPMVSNGYHSGLYFLDK